jgi:hypothetical protein
VRLRGDDVHPIEQAAKVVGERSIKNGIRGRVGWKVLRLKAKDDAGRAPGDVLRF